MAETTYVTLGRVVKTHGLAGEVSVAPAAEPPFSLLEGVSVWFVPPRVRVRAARIVSVRPGPKGPLVRFAGIEDIDAARELELGTVVDVIVTGANDVWVIDGPYGEVLVPVIDDVVRDVDEENGTARTRLLDGLIDDDKGAIEG